MNELVYPTKIEKCNTLRPQADDIWIKDCFVNYASSVISVVDEYFTCVKNTRFGIVISNEYSINVLPWSVSIDTENQLTYCNSGEMASVLFTHLESKRHFKVDLSSFSDTFVFTAFSRLSLNNDNKVDIKRSTEIFKGCCDLYQFNNPGLLSKIYNFLQFNVTDLDLNQQLINLH